MSREAGGKKKVRWILTIVIAALIVGGGYLFLQMQQSDQKAREVMKVMEDLIPGLTEESSGTSSGVGRDPLAALSIEGIDIVGCLDIPKLNLRVPVTGKELEQPFFATWVSGSPVQGTFRITGGRDDTFRNLSKTKPGDSVTFTDVDGVRYEYEVTTQYHLKEWAEADNDLLLCYPTDDQTDFVVGCTVKTEE